MFTVRLDLSLCDMWYCEALVVLLVGVLLCRVLTLPRAYCVIFMYCVLLPVSVMCHSVLSDSCFDSVCQTMRM